MSLFSGSNSTLLKLPSGSFTVDCTGRVLMGTLPSTFPEELIEEISRLVLQAFREAGEAQLPLSQLVIQYPSLRITARELRGGAIVFLAARGPHPPANHL